MDNLDKFINDILEEKKLSGVDNEVRKQLALDMKKRLLDQIDRAVINDLTNEQAKQLTNMIDAGADDAEIQKFIVDSGVDTKTVTARTMLRFRDLYLGIGA